MDFFSALWLLASGGDAGPGSNALLDPHTGLVFWQVLSFSVLVIMLSKTAWGPLIGGLEAREAKIRDALSAADKAREEAAQVGREHAALLESHRQEGEKILEEARQDAKGVLERARAEATSEADKIKARTASEIELAKAKAIEELREHSVELAMMLAGRVIGAEVDQARHKGLVDELLASWNTN